MATGCSMGAYHAANSLFRHPDQFDGLVAMSGLYQLRMFIGDEVDDAVGRIVAHLKATGEYDHTLIVFTCDHGEMGGDHYTWGKELYFDQSFHIPLIIRDPRTAGNAARGSQVAAFTESVDLMPTMLDWLDADIPAQCDGRVLPRNGGSA